MYQRVNKKVIILGLKLPRSYLIILKQLKIFLKNFAEGSHKKLTSATAPHYAISLLMTTGRVNYSEKIRHGLF